MCIKKKDNDLVSKHPDCNMDEPVPDIRPLGLPISLRNKCYHLERVSNPTQLYGHGELYSAVLSWASVCFKNGHSFNLKSIWLEIWINQWLVIDPWGYGSTLEASFIIQRYLRPSKHCMDTVQCTNLYCVEQLCTITRTLL